MRQRFKQQLEIGVVPINEVKLLLKSRHSMVNILQGLQYVFTHLELSEKVFSIVEEKVLEGKQKTGRPGMSLWELLVLGVVRQNLNTDYDELHDLSNEHRSLRGILGIARNDYQQGKQYHRQTLEDNVKLLDEATIYKINEVVLEGAHGMLKKNEGVERLDLHIKADSFVVESNISFPTDLKLLYTSLRKGLESIGYFQKKVMELSGCREWKALLRTLRNIYRWVSEIHRKKGKHYNERLEQATTQYITRSKKIVEKLKLAKAQLLEIQSNKDANKDANKGKLKIELWGAHQDKKLEELSYYIEMVEKHIDLVDRRIIQGEKIPSSEKIYSIFEDHVEWNSKGKAGKPVEFGHNTLVATNQYGFILYSKVYEVQVDKQVTIEIGNELEGKYGATENLASISFDKNFYSQPAEKSLDKKFSVVILPKAGAKSKREKEKEADAQYHELKKGHAKIEGNINELEHHGLDVCPDKGIEGFKRYVAYGVLSYNLSKLGKMINEKKRAAQNKARIKAKRAKLRAVA